MTAPRTPDAGYEEVEAQPIAWRLRVGDQDNWSYAETEADIDFYVKHAWTTKHEKQPLYSADALADMRRQRDEAQTIVDRYRAGDLEHDRLFQRIQTEHHAQLTEARAEVERLTRERDEWSAALTRNDIEANVAFDRAEAEVEKQKRWAERFRIRAEATERERDRYKEDARIAALVALDMAVPKAVDASRRAIIEAVEEWVNRARGGDATADEIAAATIEAAVNAGWVAAPSLPVEEPQPVEGRP